MPLAAGVGEEGLFRVVRLDTNDTAFAITFAAFEFAEDTRRSLLLSATEADFSLAAE